METNISMQSEIHMERTGNEFTSHFSYAVFVQELCRSLVLSTGYEKELIHFKQAGDYPPTDGDRLFIVCEKADGFKEVCGLYIEDMYKNYRHGMSIPQITAMILAELKKIKASGIMKRAVNLQSYETARKDLFIRLVNAERHKNELNQAVYHIIGDIALVLYMHVGEIDQCTTSMKICRDTIESWNVDAEKVFSDALSNTSALSPPRIYCWEKLIYDNSYDGENFMDPLSKFPLKKDATGNCLSTSKRTNGAVAIFLPGVAKRLGEMMGEDYYMAFTSIHEVMIHNARQTEPEALLEVLRETVREATPEADFLSLKIYFYDRNTDKFSFL